MWCTDRTASIRNGFKIAQIGVIAADAVDHPERAIHCFDAAHSMRACWGCDGEGGPNDPDRRRRQASGPSSDRSDRVIGQKRGTATIPMLARRRRADTIMVVSVVRQPLSKQAP